MGSMRSSENSCVPFLDELGGKADQRLSGRLLLGLGGDKSVPVWRLNWYRVDDADTAMSAKNVGLSLVG